MAGIFVTGSDTGVGKTVVAAAITAHLSLEGYDVGVMKPVQAGAGSSDGHLLLYSAQVEDPVELVVPYSLREAAAPSVAASAEKVAIDSGRLLAAFKELSNLHRAIVVEGTGGLLTPLAAGFTVADLIKRMALPALVVTSSRLGSINHTALTIRVLTHIPIPLVGVVVCHLTAEGGLAEKTCGSEIARLCDTPVLGEIPYNPRLAEGKLTRELLANLASSHLNLEPIYLAIGLR